MKKFINKHNNLLNLRSIHEEFGVPIKGIIHIGAHFGNEITDYNEIGYKNVIFVEPARRTFDALISNVKNINKDQTCNITFINKAFGSYIGEVEMFTETVNQGQSSSILEPAFHLQQYPSITFTSKEMVKLTTLNNEIKHIDGEFNLLNIDVQGYELEVLKGSTDILHEIDFINTEVNKVEVYKNCAIIDQIDDFLSEYDFVKIDENWMGEVWGDAMYIKKNYLQNE